MKNEDKLFIEGLKGRNLNDIKRVPKGDFHNHSGLGMRFERFNKWAGGKVKIAPKRMKGIEALDDYMINETAIYIKEQKDIEFLLEACILDAIEDGVKILEASVDCHWSFYFQEEKGLIRLVDTMRNKYREQIDFRPEIGLAKGIADENLKKLLPILIESGVFKSIDIYGKEELEGYDRFVDYYKYAKSKGLKLKAHAGEFMDYRLVRQAIESLDLDEVQHGIQAVNNDYTMDLIRERNIRLNICPTSNVILTAVEDYKSHPIRKLYDKGLRISINTDDLLLFHSSVSEEYMNLYENGIFEAEELNEIRRNNL